MNRIDVLVIILFVSSNEYSTGHKSEFSSNQLVSHFVSEIIRNKSCQTWSKQVEKDGYRNCIGDGSSFVIFVSEYVYLL